MLIFVAALFALIIGAAVVFSTLPKRYAVGERINQSNVFWNDHEAFLFLEINTTGRVDNALLEKLQKSKYTYWAIVLGSGPRFSDQHVLGYRLLPSGDWKQLPLPDKSTIYGDWGLQNGKLQFQPPGHTYDSRNGFRWDGEKFVPVSPEPKSPAPAAGSSRLAPDDDAEEEDGSTNFLRPAAREAFKHAGWHYKQLRGYETKSTQATLPITLGKNSFDLTIDYFPLPKREDFQMDFLNLGIKSLALSSTAKPEITQTIWSQSGWQTVSKSEFEKRAAHSGRSFDMPYSIWIWLAIILFFTVWKLTGWFYVAGKIFGVKHNMLNKMPAGYSFPPADLSQYPKLDTAELERYTREFESMGFVRLLDFSLVSTSSKPIPNFCRVFAHTRHHCFAEVSQIFPRWRSPMPLRCSIQSCLEDGWTLGFSDRKPQAASALLRRVKAIGISMPGTPPYELLQGFLQMRDQVCQDLGIAYMKDDSIDAYRAKVQRSATEMRDAVQQKNMASMIPEFYYRRISLLKTKQEYVWLGDYPKVAEQRKQGFPVAAG